MIRLFSQLRAVTKHIAQKLADIPTTDPLQLQQQVQHHRIALNVTPGTLPFEIPGEKMDFGDKSVVVLDKMKTLKEVFQDIDMSRMKDILIIEYFLAF